MMHESFAEKEKLVEERYLSKSELGDLVIYNYTDKCTYDRHWIPATLESRGTIYHRLTGKVVARAFDKFFNIGEHETTFPQNLPSLPFEISEKEDGSLGIIFAFPHDQTWSVATRGSFYSTQAERARELLCQYNMENWPRDWTPLVEIIYPENRIVIDYKGQSKLVLIAARHIETGEYMTNATLDLLSKAVGMPRPWRPSCSLEELIAEAKDLPATNEGWVIRYTNGLMVKVKGARYLEIAKFKANLSPLTVWEVMMAGKTAEFLQSCPEEFLPDAEAIVLRLGDDFGALCRRASYCAGAASVQVCSSKDDAKEIALRIQQQPSWVQGYLFSVMRGKQDKKILLKLLRPDAGVYAELPA